MAPPDIKVVGLVEGLYIVFPISYLPPRLHRLLCTDEKHRTVASFDCTALNKRIWVNLRKSTAVALHKYGTWRAKGVEAKLTPAEMSEVLRAHEVFEADEAEREKKAVCTPFAEIERSKRMVLRRKQLSKGLMRIG